MNCRPHSEAIVCPRLITHERGRPPRLCWLGCTSCRRATGSSIGCWLGGGLYAGSVTRRHDDLDMALWLEDHERIADLLTADGWKHAPEASEDGYTGYERRSSAVGPRPAIELVRTDGVLELRLKLLVTRASAVDMAALVIESSRFGQLRIVRRCPHSLSLKSGAALATAAAK